MSQNAPSSIDVQEIQFKLHRKLNVFKQPGEIKSLVHLLAVAPSKGLLFAANPYELEFKVFKLSELNSEGSEVKVRAVPLISQTLALTCSCDGSMLAVSYVFNKTGFLQIFQVDSFLSPDVNALYTMPIAPEYNVYTSQLLWNPVISNNLALILTDGSVAMFALNAGGQYDKITLNKEHQVTCGCWSPKGKQIVLGLGTGNLQQYKPNLTPARIIHSPVGLQQQPYDIIAVHWLSTFQFAAILVSKSNETLPCLYIINAPKTGQPIFINYYDICYSGPGPRQQQFTFTHILSWNLLLVTSANGVEVGVLGTKETGENPTWLQYTLLDEARIEMPLTDAKDETYPMGFALDTSCSHQLILGEKKLPVMPIIHVLTTYGQLISFNFLNLMNGAQNICSPPPPIMDASGQFINLTPAIMGGINGEVVASVAGNLTAVNTASHQGGAGLKDVTFTMHSSNMVTSTPAPKEKNNALFNNNNTTNITVKPSAATATAAVAVTATTTSTLFNVPGNTALTVASKVTGFASTSATTANIFSENNQKNASNSNIINIGKSSAVATSSVGVADSKPLYTVPPTYTPPTPPLPRDQQQKISTTEAATGNENMAAHQTPLDAYQVDEIVKRMLKLQIEAFDRELKQLKHQSDAMINNLGNRDEVKVCSKQLNDLHEIIDQAKDHEFDTDLQVLCASIDESYIVLRECRTKLEIHENADYGRLKCTPHSEAANRRQLDKLRTNLLANENDMKQVHQILEQLWSEYQDVVRRNSKHEMHMPCLDGVYQKMSKIKNLLALHRQKLQHIKNKLKESGILYKPPNEPNVNRKAANALVRSNKAMDTLTDSMLTMSLAQMVTRSRAQLTAKKMQAIRNFTKQQKQINVIRPKRPDRVGLKSDIILEIKMQTDQKQKQEKVKKVDTNKMEINFKQQQQQTQQQQHVSVKPHGKLAAHSSNLTKPQASKATPATMSANMFNTPSVASSAYTNLNISSSSSFVKTSSGAMNDQNLMKTPLANSTPFAGFTTGGSAAFNFSHQPNKSTHKDAAPTPVSFNAKVLQSNEMKISATATTSASAKTTSHQNVTNKMNGVIVNGKQQQPQESNQPVTFTKVGGSAVATTTAPLSFQLNKSTSYATLAPASAVAAASTVAAFNFNGSSNRNAGSSPAVSPTNPSTGFLHAGSKQAGAGTKSMTTTTSLANFAPSPSATFGNVANGNKSGGGGPTSSFFSPASSAANVQTKTAANATTIMSTKTTMKPIDLTTSLDFSGAEIELGSLTICKPTTKDGNDGNAKSVKSTTAPTTTSTAAVPLPFSFISAAAENGGQGKSIFGASISSTAGTPASSAFSFSIAAAGAHNTTAATTTTSIANSTAAPLSTATAATSAFNLVTTTASVAPLFGALNLTTAATGNGVNTTPTTTAHTATSANNIFGGASNIFSTTTTTPTTATTSTFGQSTNIFGGASGAGGGTTVPTTSANIFKGIPKPDQSIFGGDGDRGSDCVANTAPASNAANVPSGLFAAAAVSTKPSTNGGENIFGGGGGGGGGGKAAFNSPLGTGGGSIFGGSNTTPAGPFVSAAGGSLFGNQAKSPTESGNIFTSAAQPQQQANAAGGGSLFGKGMFGQSTSANIFGGQAQAAAATGGGFGGSPTGAASSIFGGGGGGGSAVSGGSLFGGSAASPPAFGSTASNFGSFSQPAAGSSAFGSATGFAQGGTTSVQQSGFGSSTQQPSSAFAKPVFGGTPAFGSPTPAFGAQPTFGGGPTFGSPKGFGSFAASTGSATGPPAGAAAAAAAGVGGGLAFGGATPAATKNNIFETLGSSDSGLSFGNLAQTTQQPAPPKPTFGGSSFMNYRS